MNKIIKLYNQNRMTFWIIVIVFVFVIAIIQLLNYYAGLNKKNKINNNEKGVYEQESKTIISGESVAKDKQEAYGNIIDDFLKSCINENFENAYKCISNKCKTLYYPTVENFIEKYCKNKFSANKTYSFQSWNSGKVNTYQIKIFDDMISTGKKNDDKYIEDYYTIVYENGEKRLNINNYIETIDINKSQYEEGINVNIKEQEIHKEFIIYTFEVQNDTKNVVMIDSKKDAKSIYLLNKYNVKYYGLLYENMDDDFIIKSGEKKEIKIKFNVIFRTDIELKSINFTNIITNYKQYLNENDIIKMTINL